MENTKTYPVMKTTREHIKKLRENRFNLKKMERSEDIQILIANIVMGGGIEDDIALEIKPDGAEVIYVAEQSLVGIDNALKKADSDNNMVSEETENVRLSDLSDSGWIKYDNGLEFPEEKGLYFVCFIAGVDEDGAFSVDVSLSMWNGVVFKCFDSAMNLVPISTESVYAYRYIEFPSAPNIPTGFAKMYNFEEACNE